MTREAQFDERRNLQFVPTGWTECVKRDGPREHITIMYYNDMERLLQLHSICTALRGKHSPLLRMHMPRGVGGEGGALGQGNVHVEMCARVVCAY